MRRKEASRTAVHSIGSTIGRHRRCSLTTGIAIPVGALLLLLALPTWAVECDGSEVVCIDLDSSATVEASGGVIAGGTFEDGGFRPSDRGGIDWSFGPEVDVSTGRAAFEVTGFLPTTGGELGGGKTALFTADGYDEGVLHFMKLQKMLEELLEGHLLRWGYDDDGLADGFDALIVSSGVFPCGLFQVTDWTEDETHSFELGWSPDGITIKVDDEWECAAPSNGDAFDPSTKIFTLGNHPNHPSALHADAVFRNFRLWAEGPGEQGPIVEIEGITPSPTTRAAGMVSLSGFARDQDEGGDSIVWHRWRSNLEGILGYDESLLIRASDLRAGLHRITFEARDDEGSIGRDGVDLLVTEGEPGIYTIELPAREDAKVASGVKGDPNTSYGHTEDLMAGSANPGQLDEASLLLFPIDELRGTVLEATLHLQSLNSGGQQEIYRTGLELANGSPWTEDTVTWNTAPHRSGAPIDEVPFVVDGEAYSFDVKDGIVGGEPLSLVITSVAPDGGGFQSKEHPTPFEHPMLEVRLEVEELRIFSSGFETGDLLDWTPFPR